MARLNLANINKRKSKPLPEVEVELDSYTYIDGEPEYEYEYEMSKGNFKLDKDGNKIIKKDKNGNPIFKLDENGKKIITNGVKEPEPITVKIRALKEDSFYSMMNNSGIDFTDDNTDINSLDEFICKTLYTQCVDPKLCSDEYVNGLGYQNSETPWDLVKDVFSFSERSALFTELQKISMGNMNKKRVNVVEDIKKTQIQ